MAVLPTKPPAFDRNDVVGTVKKLCDYNLQLQEQLDFQLAQMNKMLSAMQKAQSGQ